MLRLPYFRVVEIHVEGNLQVATEDVVAGLGLSPESSILEVNLETLAQRVLRNPWIKEASVRRQLPLSLTVQVVERMPEAVFIADRRYLLLADGVILAALEPDELPTLPTLRAIRPHRVRTGERVLDTEIVQGLAVWRQFQIANALQGEMAHGSESPKRPATIATLRRGQSFGEIALLMKACAPPLSVPPRRTPGC